MKYIIILLMVILVGCTSTGRGVYNIREIEHTKVAVVDKNGVKISSYIDDYTSFITLESCISEAKYIHEDGMFRYGTYVCEQKLLGYFILNNKIFIWGDEQLKI